MPSHSRVALKPYDSQWRVMFQTEAAKIRAAIGQHLGDPANDIQHIGSTSVPDLPSKGTIDILVGLASASVADACVQLLAAPSLGYVRQAQFESARDRRYVCKPDTGWTHVVHLIARNDPLWDRFIKFRDAMRGSPVLRDVYARLKEQWAEEHCQDVPGYTRAKTPFILAVISAT